MVSGMVTIMVPKMQHYEEVAKEHFFLVPLDSGSKSPKNALLRMWD